MYNIRYIYIYITSKDWLIKKGFTFKKQQNNFKFTMPEDCASMKL